MGSLFDSNVYERRHATPWATISLKRFVQEMALNGDDPARDASVVLTARFRPDVATRFWYRLEWTGEDGERSIVEASEMELLLWRAAETELRTRARLAKGSVARDRDEGSSP